MNIFFHITTLDRGGAERAISNIALALKKNGNKITFITTLSSRSSYNNDIKIISLLNDEQIKFHNYLIKFNYVGIVLAYLYRNIISYKKLRYLLKTYKPDLVVSFLCEPNIRTVLASLGLNIKTILSVRNDPKIEYRHYLHEVLAHLLFKKASGIVFQTVDAQNFFDKEIRNKSVIIPNFINEEFINHAIFNGKRKNIVTTGRLVIQKNHKLLIKAFKNISKEFEDNLIIYGDGDYKSELERYIKLLGLEKRVFLPGNVYNVADSIYDAKLFVLTSDYEGMPNSLMEAMALGLPCISTDCPCGGPRFLFNDSSGILVPINNEKQLTNELRRILSDESLRNDLGNKARLRSLDFKESFIVNQWQNHINKIFI